MLEYLNNGIIRVPSQIEKNMSRTATIQARIDPEIKEQT